MTTTIVRTPLARLAEDGRLFNAVLNGPMKEGVLGYRGDIALKFPPQKADEKRPPSLSMEQVITCCSETDETLPILIGYLHSLEYLTLATEVLEGMLSPTGTYILFCNNVDIHAQYKVTLGGVSFLILPCDETTVWKEMTDLLGIEKSDMKKLSTAGKTDHVLSAALGYSGSFEEISFEEGLQRMEPVKNRNENRPV